MHRHGSEKVVRQNSFRVVFLFPFKRGVKTEACVRLLCFLPGQNAAVFGQTEDSTEDV